MIFRKLAVIVYTFKWVMGLGILLFTMILGASIFRLKIDPSMETLFIKNSDEYRYYREYSRKYGSDQMIAAAMATTDLFTVSKLKLLDQVTKEITKFPQVERTLSLSNAMDIRSKIIGIKIVPAMEGIFEGERSLKDLKKEVLSNELYLNNIVSKDGKIANILIYLKQDGKEGRQGGIFIEKLRAYLQSLEGKGVRFYVAGSPVEQYDFIKLIRRDQFVFVPLITVLLIATTFLIYRSFSCMLLSMSIVFTTLVWTLGTIALLGKQLNLMTSLLAPVIMIVSVVNSIYLINVFFEVRQHHHSLRSAIVTTMQQLGVPCFLTHLVAVLGFISLALSQIPAIRSFGIFAALGTFYSYVVELILTPMLFPILPYRFIGKPSKKRDRLNDLLVGFIEKLDLRWKWLILLTTAVILVFAVMGIKKIQVDTNIVKQMKPNLPLAVSTRFIDENLTGVYSLGFVLRRRDNRTFADYGTLQKVDAFKTYLESKPEISKVNVITTVIKKIHFARNDGDPKSYKIPKKKEDLERYLQGITTSGNSDAEQFISRDLREIRLEARMRAVGTREGAAVEASARQYLKEKMGSEFEYDLTGNVVLLGKIAKGLIHEQLHSFGFALGSIIILMIIIFRSIRLGLLAAIPNLIPIVAVYGLMGHIAIELSTPTAMISSIVLGLVVDASIQYLYRFRIEFEHRGHYLQALHHTCESMGQSMFVSTMILVVGFAASVFASFRPTVHFGALTSLTIFLAFLCTLLVLPVCILLLKPFGRQRLFRRPGGHHLGVGESIQKKTHL